MVSKGKKEKQSAWHGKKGKHDRRRETLTWPTVPSERNVCSQLIGVPQDPAQLIGVPQVPAQSCPKAAFQSDRVTFSLRVPHSFRTLMVLSLMTTRDTLILLSQVLFAPRLPVNSVSSVKTSPSHPLHFQAQLLLSTGFQTLYVPPWHWWHYSALCLYVCLTLVHKLWGRRLSF